MMNEHRIRRLLEDIKTTYEVGYINDDLETEAQKWAQIEILEWILSE